MENSCCGCLKGNKQQNGDLNRPEKAQRPSRRRNSRREPSPGLVEYMRPGAGDRIPQNQIPGSP